MEAGKECTGPIEKWLCGQAKELRFYLGKKTGRSVPELDFKQKRESMRGVHLRRGKAKCRDTNWESCGFFFFN